MQHRLTELDCLRGAAALLVCVFHYTERYDQLYDHQLENLYLFEIGHTGVYLFFILSGFVISLTLNRTKSAYDFIVSRVSRLYPAYWAAILITFTSYQFYYLEDREVSFSEALVNLTMLQRWLNVPNVDGVYWTLSVELMFYGIMLLIFLSNQLKNLTKICAAWIGFIIVSCMVSHHKGWEFGADIDYILLMRHGNLFIAGIMFYKLWESKKILYLGILLACLVPEYFLRKEVLPIVLAYFGVFFLFVQGGLRWLSFKPFVYLGAISYGFYLVHQNIGYIVIQTLYESGLATPWSVVLVPMLLSIAFASLIYYAVEQPSLKGIREGWKGSQLRKKLTGETTRQTILRPPAPTAP